jgi:hypothetical protein
MASKIEMGNYLLVSVLAAIGNAAHFAKKNITGQTNREMLGYLKDHSILMIMGILIAMGLAIAQSVTIFQSGDGALLTAFLTGYTADSILGQYTPPESINRQ